MGKIAPPPVVKIDTSEAAFTLEQMVEAQRRLVDAFKGMVGNQKTISPVRRMRPCICTQCGAPLHGERCEFCGTQYK